MKKMEKTSMKSNKTENTAEVKPGPKPGQKRAPKAEVEDLPILDTPPIPLKRNTRLSNLAHNMGRLDVGRSFIYKNDEGRSMAGIRSSVSQYSKRNGKKFSVFQTTEGIAVTRNS